MKLHNNKINQLLIYYTTLLADSEEIVLSARGRILEDDDATREELTDIALYISNKYLNEYEPMLESPTLLQQQNFFNGNIRDVVNDYYSNNLPEINYDETEKFMDNYEKDCLTVGALRLSALDDNTPIVFYNYMDGSAIKASSPKVLFLNETELNNNPRSDNMVASIKKDENHTIMGITF